MTARPAQLGYESSKPKPTPPATRPGGRSGAQPGTTRRCSRGFGHVHIYLSYGVSWLTNMAAAADGGGAGVLFRASEPM
jgi:hypothetical protein